MSKKMKVGLLVGVFLITALAFAENSGQLSAATVSVAAGQPATAAALPETPAAQAKPAAPAKKPLGINYGVIERMRVELINNATDFNGRNNDENRIIKLRTLPFASIDFNDYLGGYIRVGNESWKKWMTTVPASQTQYSAPFVTQEIWIDNAYLDIKKLPGSVGKNISLRLGRQDFNRADGFFFQTSSWAEGPRSGFDPLAGLITYSRPKDKFEFIAGYTPHYDDLFPVMNGTNPASGGLGCNSTYWNGNAAALPNPTTGAGGLCQASVPSKFTESDFVQAGLYYTNRMLKTTDIDAFVMNYHIYGMPLLKQYALLPGLFNATGQAGLATPGSTVQQNLSIINNVTAGAGLPSYMPDHHYVMFGGRVVHRFPHTITAVGEFGYEAGSQNAMTPANNPLFAFAKSVGATTACTGSGSTTGCTTTGFPAMDWRAWASYGYVTKYFPKNRFSPYVRFQWMLMSGQDPKNLKEVTSWEALNGRWSWSPNMPAEYGWSAPTFSDTLMYNLQREYAGVPGGLQNEKTVGFEAGFMPVKNRIRLMAAYLHEGAFHPLTGDPIHYDGGYAVNAFNETCPTVAGKLPGYTLATWSAWAPTGVYFSCSGTNRAQIVKARMNFYLTKVLGGHVSLEKAYYGDFYAFTNRQAGYLMRWQMDYTFSKFLPYKKSKV